MLNFLNRNKPETDEERFIRYADTIVAHSDFNGELNKECLDFHITLWNPDETPLIEPLAAIRREIFMLKPNDNDGTTVNADITTKYIQNNYDTVKNHLLNNGYIDKPDHELKWVLNERGKDMKRLKGHKKYQEYLDKKTKAEIAEMNGKIYWKKRAFVSALIGLILGILISWIAIKLGLPTPMRTSP